MKVYLIGTGVPGTLTAQAAEAIAEADILIGAQRMLAPYANSDKFLLECWKAEKIANYLQTSPASCAAVLLSGDCGFYSGAAKLRKALTGHEVHSIPGIASPVYLCAKLGISWEDMHFVSLHGIDDSIAIHVRKHRKCCFLLGGRLSAAEVCRILCTYGLGSVKVSVGERLGYPEEHILTGTAETCTALPRETLSVLITENPDACLFHPVGIPDDAFIRNTVPMTKAEIRCAILSALRLAETDICCDIGCGTGSVSVEAAFQCRQVFAFDPDPEAVSLTRQNARKFGCDNITIIPGSFPECLLPEMPAPDKLFIGGSGGKLAEILQAVSRNIPIVMTAVSLETLGTAMQYLETSGRTCTVTQLAVTRTRKAGGHTLFQANNPVFLIRGMPV